MEDAVTFQQPPANALGSPDYNMRGENSASVETVNNAPLPPFDVQPEKSVSEEEQLASEIGPDDPPLSSSRKRCFSLAKVPFRKHYECASISALIS